MKHKLFGVWGIALAIVSVAMGTPLLYATLFSTAEVLEGEITDVYVGDAKSMYEPGEQISIAVYTRLSDGSNGTPDRGWKVGYMLYSQDISAIDDPVIREGFADYMPELNLWSIQISLPYEAGEYGVSIDFSCLQEYGCQTPGYSSTGIVRYFEVGTELEPVLHAINMGSAEYYPGEAASAEIYGIIDQTNQPPDPEENWNVRLSLRRTSDGSNPVTVTSPMSAVFQSSQNRWHVSFSAPEQEGLYVLTAVLGCWPENGCTVSNRSDETSQVFKVVPDIRNHNSSSAVSSAPLLPSNNTANEEYENRPVYIVPRTDSEDKAPVAPLLDREKYFPLTQSEKEPAPAATSVFSDLTSVSLVGRAANNLATRGIIQGFPDGQFKANLPVNRAEAAKFLLNAASIQVSGVTRQPPVFWDTTSGAWYTPFIEGAAYRGIINGYHDGSFRPAQSVNTVEFLKMLSLTFGLQESLPYPYRDVPKDAWFERYAGIASFYDLFPGRSMDMLYPERTVTREEIAVAIYNMLLKENR